MFRFLNKHLKNNRISNRIGQVALLLILIIAILFIFYAVVLNLGRVSQVKTVVTIASNTSAAFMASAMASYAESVYQTTLGGGPQNPDPNAGDDLTICGVAGVAAAFVTLIIIIIAILITYMTGGYGGPHAASTAIAVISVILASLSIVIQMVWTQPGMNDMWNKQMVMVGGPADQFVENGLKIALQQTVDDTKQVIDEQDMDMDGLTTDEAPRFGYWYTARLKNKIPLRRLPNLEVIENFKTRLGKFLYKVYKGEDDGWGVWDPIADACDGTLGQPACCTANPPPECNACCFPEDQRECGCPGDSNPIPCCPFLIDDPQYATCAAGAKPCCRSLDSTAPIASSANCSWSMAGARYPPTPFVPPGNQAVPAGYPYLFDPLYENRENNTGPGSFVSLREYFGHDDETPYYKKNPANPTGSQISDSRIVTFRRDDVFNGGDFFPALWDITPNALGDSRVYLPPLVIARTEDFCYWYAIRDTALIPGCQTLPVEGRLQLPFDCSPAWLYNQCKVSPSFDEVTHSTNIRKPNTWCPDAGAGWWKAGDVRYCTRNAPPAAYQQDNCPGLECGANCPTGVCNDASTADARCHFFPGLNACSDPQATRTLWTGDSVDEFRGTIDAFIVWAKEVLALSPEAIAERFSTWYPEAEVWLRAGGSPDGALHEWLSPTEIPQWKNDLTSWRNANYPGPNCNEECYPSPIPGLHCLHPGVGACDDISVPDKEPGHDYNDAHIPDVISCLDCRAQKDHALGQMIDLCQGWCNTWNPSCWSARCNIPLTFFPRNCNATEPACVNDNVKIFHNNEAKHKFRRDFLQRLYDKTGDMVATLTDTESKINAFLTDPAVTALASEWNRLQTGNNAADASMLAPFALYAWRSDPTIPPRPPPNQNKGYWHIAYVETRVPTRCQYRCARGERPSYKPPGTPGSVNTEWHEPGFPWVKKYSKRWGTSGCFTLGDSFDNYPDGTPNFDCDDENDYYDGNQARLCFRGGQVKSRVIRYDEDKDILLRFANAMPIWRFLAHHPSRAPASASLITQMETDCAALGAASGAFMINNAAENATVTQCYNTVRKFLYRGVMSQTCAEYYFHQTDPYGFNVKFVPCQGDF